MIRGIVNGWLSLIACLFVSCASPLPDSAGPVPAEVPYPETSAVQIPAGYRADLIVTGLTYPSSIEFDGKGAMYIAEAGFSEASEKAPAQVLKISANGEIRRLAEGLSSPITDLLWHKGRLYISHRGRISVIEEDRPLRDIVTGLPSYGDYHNNQLTVGPDGKIYVGQGTATNSGIVGIDSLMQGWLGQYPDVHDLPPRDVELRGQEFETLNPFAIKTGHGPVIVRTSAFQPFGRTASVAQGVVKANGTILRLNPDGSDIEVYAWGLRNPMGAAWSPDGKLYVTEGSYDERGSRPIANAPDNLYEIRQGGWYGWPDFASGIPVTDSRYRPESGAQPEFLLKEHPPVEKPALTLSPHVGVAKMDFSHSRRFGFEGQIFLALTGDIQEGPEGRRAPDQGGYQVVRINLNSHEVRTFFQTKPYALGPAGWEHAITPGLKRPIDVRFSPRGDALYIVDMGSMAPTGHRGVMQPVPGSGAIWRITRVESKKIETPWKVVPVRATMSLRGKDASRMP